MKQEPKGLIYTILAGEKPIVALEASGREAGQLCKEEWFRSEMAELRSSGDPVCVPGSKLRARPATEDERSSYYEGAKEAKVGDDLVLVYLVDLDSP
jgi:hypothetical protein